MAEANELPEKQEPIVTPDVASIVRRALGGDLPRSRSLKYWEPDTLTPMHLQAIFKKALGYSNNEIAQELDLTPSRVSIILGHPDAQTVLAAIAGHMADRISDPLERAAATAGEALDTVIQTMRDTKDERVRRRCALDVLEVAGYGKGSKAPTTQNNTVINMAAPAADRLSRTLEQVQTQMKDISQYTQYLITAPSGSVAVPSQAEALGTPEPVVDSPPVSDSRTQDAEAA